jgi:hypothetical protein
MSVRKSFTDPSDTSGAIFDLSSSVTGLTAAGSTQGTALALDYTTYQRVSTVAASTGVRLPAAVAGARIVVFNMGANALAVYPSTGENINALAANAALSITAAKGAEFVCCATGSWCTITGA